MPSGASTGAHEAVELRDGTMPSYGGKGVLRAVANVNGPIADELVAAWTSLKQAAIDQTLIKLDGTPNKAALGANAILGVSLACLRAAADEVGVPLYRYVGGITARTLPVPMMNILNGGKHADEQHRLPGVHGAAGRGVDLSRGRCGWAPRSTTHSTGVLHKRGHNTNVGDEGGFAPSLPDNRAPLDLIIEAIETAGYKPGDDMALGAGRRPRPSCTRTATTCWSARAPARPRPRWSPTTRRWSAPTRSSRSRTACPRTTGRAGSC